ncbi:MAG: DUF2442 domain-containing protein [Flavobacteriaceae bacterium]|nr:DUF2442 domain-containing protein [Flavobacteriaceae bacterium]
MLHFIKEIKQVNDNYKVVCLFNDGAEKTINLLPLIEKYGATEIISQLKNPDYFKTVSLDSYGTLTWSNGVDFCPDVLYAMA